MRFQMVLWTTLGLGNDNRLSQFYAHDFFSYCNCKSIMAWITSWNTMLEISHENKFLAMLLLLLSYVCGKNCLRNILQNRKTSQSSPAHFYLFLTQKPALTERKKQDTCYQNRILCDLKRSQSEVQISWQGEKASKKKIYRHVFQFFPFITLPPRKRYV